MRSLYFRAAILDFPENTENEPVYGRKNTFKANKDFSIVHLCICGQLDHRHKYVLLSESGIYCLYRLNEWISLQTAEKYSFDGQHRHLVAVASIYFQNNNSNLLDVQKIQTSLRFTNFIIPDPFVNLLFIYLNFMLYSIYFKINKVHIFVYQIQSAFFDQTVRTLWPLFSMLRTHLNSYGNIALY